VINLFAARQTGVLLWKPEVIAPVAFDTLFDPHRGRAPGFRAWREECLPAIER
jgi:hypothetical protein